MQASAVKVTEYETKPPTQIIIELIHAYDDVRRSCLEEVVQTSSSSVAAALQATIHQCEVTIAALERLLKMLGVDRPED